MSTKSISSTVHFPSELHTKLKLHARTEMRSFHSQVIYILEAYAKAHKLEVGDTATDDLDFVEE